MAEWREEVDLLEYFVTFLAMLLSHCLNLGISEALFSPLMEFLMRLTSFYLFILFFNFCCKAKYPNYVFNK